MLIGVHNQLEAMFGAKLIPKFDHLPKLPCRVDMGKQLLTDGVECFAGKMQHH